MNNTPPDQLPSTEKSSPQKKIKARNHSLFEPAFKKIDPSHPKIVHICIHTKKMPSSVLPEEGTERDTTRAKTYIEKTTTVGGSDLNYEKKPKQTADVSQ